MRSRGIKPGFFTDHNLAKCSWPARTLFIGLWMIADREGRLDDDPEKIQAQMFLFFHSEDVSALIDELASRNFLVRYTVKENRYIQIRNFKKHQNPHRNESASVIPGHETVSDSSLGATTSRLGASAPDLRASAPVITMPIVLTPDSGLLTPDSGPLISESGAKIENCPPPTITPPPTFTPNVGYQTADLPQVDLPEGKAKAAAEIAQQWCFVCTRRSKFGQPVDTVPNLYLQFAELIRIGVPHEAIRQEVAAKGRDRNEQFFHLADRLKKRHPPQTTQTSAGMSLGEKLRQEDDELQEYLRKKANAVKTLRRTQVSGEVTSAN